MECEAGFDGGLPQQFLLELVEMPALRLARNLSLQVSTFDRSNTCVISFHHYSLATHKSVVSALQYLPIRLFRVLHYFTIILLCGRFAMYDAATVKMDNSLSSKNRNGYRFKLKCYLKVLLKLCACYK